MTALQRRLFYSHSQHFLNRYFWKIAIYCHSSPAAPRFCVTTAKGLLYRDRRLLESGIWTLIQRTGTAVIFSLKHFCWKKKVSTGNPEQKSRGSFQLRLKHPCRKGAWSFCWSSFLVPPQEAEHWRQPRGCFVFEVKILWVKVSSRILQKYCSQKHSAFLLVFGLRELGRQKRVALQSWPQSEYCVAQNHAIFPVIVWLSGRCILYLSVVCWR